MNDTKTPKTIGNYILLGLHVSLVLIVIGACLTFFTSKEGTITLSNDSNKSKTSLDIPFHILLQDFDIHYYTGTTTPSDYVSTLQIIDGTKQIKTTLSMNKIVKYRGYRFSQLSYNKEGDEIVLHVSYDPYGIFVVYSGYFIFIFCFFIRMISKIKNFYKTFTKLSVVLLFILPQYVSAQSTITKTEAKELSKIAVYYNGRIAPIDSYARDFLKEIHGSDSYGKFDAVQVLFGFYFYPEQWNNQSIIKLDNQAMQNSFEKKDFYSLNYLLNIFGSNSTFLSSNSQDYQEIYEKISLLIQWQKGYLMTIFPQNNQWLSPISSTEKMIPGDTSFVKHILTYMLMNLQISEHDEVMNTIENISLFQHKRTTSNLISLPKIKFEILLNKFSIHIFLFIFNLVISTLLLLYIILNQWHTNNLSLLKWVRRLGLFSFLLLSIEIAGRWWISGHIPLSNQFETLLIIAWITLLFLNFVGKKDLLLCLMSFLISGFVLLVASFNSINSQISSLEPVLSSPWLTAHVLVIMIAYSLFAFTCIIALFYLFFYYVKKEINMQMNKFTELSKVILYFAIFFLSVGIVLGSIWANLSWGRYWGWDPKETWALITFLCYVFLLHGNRCSILRRPIVYHILIILAFGFVVMTYFGVNYLGRGMHSYA